MNTCSKKEKKNSKSSKNKPMQMECGSTHCQQVMHHPMYMQQPQHHMMGMMPNSLPQMMPPQPSQMYSPYQQQAPNPYASLQQQSPFMSAPMPTGYPMNYATTTTTNQYWKQPIEMELGSYPAPYSSANQQQPTNNNNPQQQQPQPQQPCLTYNCHPTFQPQW